MSKENATSDAMERAETEGWSEISEVRTSENPTGAYKVAGQTSPRRAGSNRLPLGNHHTAREARDVDHGAAIAKDATQRAANRAALAIALKGERQVGAD